MDSTTKTTTTMKTNKRQYTTPLCVVIEQIEPLCITVNSTEANPDVGAGVKGRNAYDDDFETTDQLFNISD